MKSYTDLEQSKKLAEILPIESADMRYAPFGDIHPWVWDGHLLEKGSVPCWSLAALIDQLEDVICDEDGNQWELVIKKEGVQYDLYYLIVYGEQENIELDHFHDDLIDCCVEIILKLHEQKLI